MKVSKNWIEGGDHFFKKSSGQKGRGGRKYKLCSGDEIFLILIYSLLAIMVTDTAFRKSSLENIFLKVVVPVTSKHCSYHTGLLVFCRKFRLICLRVPELVLQHN